MKTVKTIILLIRTKMSPANLELKKAICSNGQVSSCSQAHLLRKGYSHQSSRTTLMESTPHQNRHKRQNSTENVFGWQVNTVIKCLTLAYITSKDPTRTGSTLLPTRSNQMSIL